ncbi:hypothetical protein E4T44_00365 [Aureobasidium sp. EXF-8845]|nr:hypothetical protein E4T44_00365 [Aureobasidium sp. EXF-8845]KAI4857917.1 hypothetical protein E4T45_00574 [Aureobasidium sp. EXF-8846]
MSDVDKQSALAEAFVSGTLNSIQDFWFSHLADKTHVIVPSIQDINVWFVDKSDEYDDLCRQKFGSLLNIIISQQASAKDILAAAKPVSALDWMSLIVLIDQIPRNCYRGMEAAKVFNFFDPLALTVALRAQELAIHLRSEIRYKTGYRLWLFMPFEHAEDIKMQESMVEEQKLRLQDVELLIQGKVDIGDDGVRFCREVLVSNKEELSILEKALQKAVDEHHDAIKRFGRFPYRNVALERVSKQEEQAFLKAM